MPNPNDANDDADATRLGQVVQLVLACRHHPEELLAMAARRAGQFFEQRPAQRRR
jgi:hypothetical protein